MKPGVFTIGRDPDEGALLPGGAQCFPDECPTDQIIPVAPPVPAAYLVGAPCLPDELLAEIGGRKKLSRPLDDRAQALIDTLKAQIRFRREAYERANGVVIIPEKRAI